MLGGSKEGTLKPGAPMVKGSKDSAEVRDSFMNLDSSELKSEPDVGAAEEEEEEEDGSAKPVLPLYPCAVGVSEAEEPESEEADGACGMANDMMLRHSGRLSHERLQRYILFS